MTASVFPTPSPNLPPLGIFAHPGPRWFTLAAGRPFAEDLAAGLCEALLPAGPEALSEVLILTPTRRAARAVAQGFLSVTHSKPMLLPQIRAVGDLEVGEPPFEPGDLVLDLPPPVSPLERQLILARLILKQDPALGGDTPRALELAEALAGFLESAAIEGVSDAEKLESLVEADYARHWRQSAAFLAIALKLWPQTLAQMGRMDPTRRRVVLLERLAEQWRNNPPAHPVIAAGSTGTAPATADLLAVVAAAPMGAVVLPGLDQGLAESAWDLVGESHPQGAMKRLLDRHGIERASVRLWPSRRLSTPAERARRRIVQEALRPAEATADWRDQIDKLRAETPDGDTLRIGFEGLRALTVRHEDEAAMTAAILLRESLEQGQGSAALITPDPALARRVRARLSRWGIVPDSSAGTPLLGYPTGRLLMAVAELAEDPLNPVLWLAVVKHPLFRMGHDAETLKPLIGTLEREALRGPRCQSLAALLKRLDRYSEARALAESFGQCIQDFAAAFRPDQDLVAALTHLVTVLEAVARTGPASDQTGGLWAGAGGELAASLLADWLSLSHDLPNVTPAGFTAVVARMLSGATVRTGGATHPQISILGTIEARLVQADRIILAGLEEGVWPAAAPVDPFLSRPMRAALGLPPPERRIGLAAHDFAQAACAPEVDLI
ncbi:MAG: double-strand break repair protein AddB, partial [Asticcacaulis sp.]